MLGLNCPLCKVLSSNSNFDKSFSIYPFFELINTETMFIVVYEVSRHCISTHGLELRDRQNSNAGRTCYGL